MTVTDIHKCLFNIHTSNAQLSPLCLACKNGRAFVDIHVERQRNAYIVVGCLKISRCMNVQQLIIKTCLFLVLLLEIWKHSKAEKNVSFA